MPWDAPGSTAIVVLALEAEPVVGEWYATNSQAGAEGMAPHVTLLVPFVPEPFLDESVRVRLETVFGAVAPFDYRLPRFERFEGGVLYLAPEPADPFAALIRSLMAEFPDYQPYDGVHDDVVPHLTVAVTSDDELVARITEEVELHLPVECRAAEATVVARGEDFKWRSRAQYQFGG